MFIGKFLNKLQSCGYIRFLTFPVLKIVLCSRIFTAYLTYSKRQLNVLKYIKQTVHIFLTRWALKRCIYSFERNVSQIFLVSSSVLITNWRKWTHPYSNQRAIYQIHSYADRIELAQFQSWKYITYYKIKHQKTCQSIIYFYLVLQLHQTFSYLYQLQVVQRKGHSVPYEELKLGFGLRHVKTD